MLRFGASAVGTSALLERFNERRIDASDKQVRHNGTYRI